MADVAAIMFCTGCGTRLSPEWSFCAACGNRVSAWFAEDRAEAVRTDDIDALSEASELLAAHRYEDAKQYLDEAIARAPDVYALRVQRASLLARLGLFPDALEDCNAAGHLLPRGDIEERLAWQELYRFIREREKHCFSPSAALPRLPRWLARYLGRDSPPASRSA